MVKMSTYYRERLMLETLISTLIYCKYKKYTIKPLFTHKEIYYVLGIELIYLVVQLAIFNDMYGLIRYASLLKSVYLCSYLGLIFKYMLYKEALIGSGFMLLGGVCNQIAIRVNNGKMPVFPSLSYLTGYATPEGFEIAGRVANDFHIMGSEQTKLIFLTDVFDIGYSVLSIGDLLIRVFVIVVVYGAVKKLQSPIKRKENIIKG